MNIWLNNIKKNAKISTIYKLHNTLEKPIFKKITNYPKENNNKQKINKQTNTVQNKQMYMQIL